MTGAENNSISLKNTVFALSTPVGGAIAVIRASGPLSRPVLKEIFTGRIEERMMGHGRIMDGCNVLDECMAVLFTAPHSYTGEDMFELDIHGSYAVVEAVSALLIKKGLRPAPPGEFTKRAFLNGKMDLVQADAVMDLINAETERSASAAMDQLRGGLSKRIGSIESRLLDFSAELCAAMDYPEEMEDEVVSKTCEVLLPLISELDTLIENGKNGRVLREGGKLVILGKPNAGKSSLMNALLGENRAIVTEYAGTTRDVLTEQLSILGVPVRLVDTAGLRESTDPVERIGIERAESEAETADCTLYVFDCTAPREDPRSEDRALAEKAAGQKAIFVVNKCDLSRTSSQALAAELAALEADASVVLLSCKTGEGLDHLKKKIAFMMGARDERPIVTNARHIDRLAFARDELSSSLDVSEPDLISEHLLSALAALSEITGREFSEELLDTIFSRFCVGK